jgi:hypothetical protein
MWKKFHDTKKDQDLPVIIAGYQGSPDAEVTAKVTQDVEFGAAIATLGKGSVTFLLWKVQSADSPKEESAPASCPVEGEEESSVEGEEVSNAVLPCSDSESDVTCAREVTKAESPGSSTGDAAGASLRRNGRKRQRLQCLDDDDFDSD